MILNIFTDLASNFNSNISSDFYNALPLNLIFFVIIIIFGLTIFLIFSFLILPLFKRSPEKLYKKYLYLRDEMQKIDDQYSAKKIIFDEYVSLQFLNAQEYYAIVKQLAANPDFKSKLKGYTLKDNFEKSSSSFRQSAPVKLTPNEMEKKQVDKLCEVLKPKASMYTKEDIYAVLLSDGFSNKLIESVIRELINQNVVFSKKASSPEVKKDLSLFLDNLFESKSDESNKSVSKEDDISGVMSNKKETSTLFEKDFKRKELNFDKVEDVDYTFKSDVDVKKKPGFFKRLFSIFKKKEVPVKKPSITEIDNILKNIESEIKGKEL